MPFPVKTTFLFFRIWDPQDKEAFEKHTFSSIPKSKIMNFSKIVNFR